MPQIKIISFESKCDTKYSLIKIAKMSLGKYFNKKTKNEPIPQKVDPFFSKFETDPYMGPKVEKGIEYITENELNQIIIDKKILTELMEEVEKHRFMEKSSKLKDQEIQSWRIQLDDMKIKYNELKQASEKIEMEYQLEIDVLKRKVKELESEISARDDKLASYHEKIKILEQEIERLNQVVHIIA